jgi:UDP-N-acetylmuramoyl-tripeptide--D-alanyl-D-alanine ligase
MNPMNLWDVALALDAIEHPRPLEGRIEGVSTDSRTVGPDELFFALRGDRFDGHGFVSKAIGRGAAAAVVSRDGLSRVPDWCRDRVFVVRDTREALLDLAAAYRSRLGATIVAVTGSCGKTTTKDLIHAVLSVQMRGVSSQKSYNNDVGVPLTVFEVEEHHDYAVLEIGANAHGEIDELAAVAEPRIGVITNIRPVHIEGFGSLEGVARAKGELVRWLPRDGVFVFNPAERGMMSLARRFAGGLFSYGDFPSCHLRGERVRFGDTALGMRIRGVDFEIPVIGRHNALNVLAAVSVGWILGVPLGKMAAALRRFEAPSSRMKRSDLGGVTLIDDAYNANPASVLSAMQAFREMRSFGRKILVLGDMMELGTRSLDFHRIIGRAAAELNPDLTVSVGPLSGATASTMVARGVPSPRIAHFEETEAAASHLASLLRRGDLVLLKASRKMKFEKIRSAIEGRWSGTRTVQAEAVR